MTTAGEYAATIGGWPEVAAASEQVREAAKALRFHEALRRRIPEAAAESRVRGARASAALDGVPSSEDVVREHLTGARPWSAHPDPGEAVLRGAVQATAEAVHVAPLLRRSPVQALARLHTAAAALLGPQDEVGRPRRVDTVAELTTLGPAPIAAQVPGRLAALADLLTTTTAPGLVVAALAHAEIATLRPFARGNAIVARAAERALLLATGLESTGVAVPEAGYLRAGETAYLGALTAYSLGTREGLTLWVRHCADAIIAGAEEGGRICDAVRAGRLPR